MYAGKTVSQKEERRYCPYVSFNDGMRSCNLTHSPHKRRMEKSLDAFACVREGGKRVGAIKKKRKAR